MTELGNIVQGKQTEGERGRHKNGDRDTIEMNDK